MSDLSETQVLFSLLLLAAAIAGALIWGARSALREALDERRNAAAREESLRDRSI